MEKNMPRLSMLPAIAMTFLLSLLSASAAAERNDWKRFSFELEGGLVWQTRNDVRIPGDTGTEFSFQDLTGSGPYATARLTFDWNIRERHGVRFVVAPLQFDDTGTFDRPISFAGATFAPDTSTKGTYQFDTYRVSYRYLFFNKTDWRMRAGATILVRDAKIELEQNGLTASDSDFGWAPLLNFSTEWAFAERWTAILDFEGLAGGPGRALDLALKVHYDLTDRWSLGAGYRTLEGGVDSDDVYNFSWFHYGLLTVRYQF
jgi:hypothetical protein